MFLLKKSAKKYEKIIVNNTYTNKVGDKNVFFKMII